MNLLLKAKVKECGGSRNLDTLSWEAHREGHDDACYLATLRRALAAVEGPAGAELVARTRTRLEEVGMDIDLEKCCRGMDPDPNCKLFEVNGAVRQYVTASSQSKDTVSDWERRIEV